jgi:hypothetical protein
MLINLVFTGILSGQDWKFIKERDGIKIYTRNEEDNPVKSFRGEMDLKASMEQISKIIGSIESFDWWADDISEIKVLDYSREKYIKYYLVYDVPWPLEDRDLCVETLITNDTVKGTRLVKATPLVGVIPEKPDMVRIKNYWQSWTIEPAGAGILHLTLEGSVDPGGSIPAWIINMVIADTPLSIMRQVKEQLGKVK